MIETIRPLAAIASPGALQAVTEFLQKGGLFMIPLGITSIAGMTAILYKFLALSRNRVIPGALARQVESFQELIAADRIEPVLKEFNAGHSALARLAAVAVKYRGKPQSDITMAVESASREETARLQIGRAHV